MLSALAILSLPTTSQSSSPHTPSYDLLSPSTMCVIVAEYTYYTCGGYNLRNFTEHCSVGAAHANWVNNGRVGPEPPFCTSHEASCLEAPRKTVNCVGQQGPCGLEKNFRGGLQ